MANITIWTVTKSRSRSVEITHSDSAGWVIHFRTGLSGKGPSVSLDMPIDQSRVSRFCATDAPDARGIRTRWLEDAGLRAELTTALGRPTVVHLPDQSIPVSKS